MSKYLSAILGVSDDSLSRTLQALESATQHKSIDVRIVAEIRQIVRSKLIELGLDPVDTTAQELYFALRAKARQDDAAVRQKLSIAHDTPSDEVLCRVGAYMAESEHLPMVWSVKRPALKKMLAAHVPHKAMKALHYRSEASMFKRETPATIYATALLVEGKTYKTKMLSAMRKLHTTDFESRTTEIVIFSPKVWESVSQFLKIDTVPVYALAEVNAVVVLPITTARSSGLVLATLALMLKELFRVKVQASYIKVCSPTTEAHELLNTVANNQSIPMTTVQNIHVAWHHMYQTMANNLHLLDELGPHLSDDDVSWLSVESGLASIVPQLDFWVGTHRVAFVSDTHIVSMHIVDVALSELYDKKLEDASRYCVQKDLYDEIVLRYMAEPPLSGIVASRLQKMAGEPSQILYD